MVDTVIRGLDSLSICSNDSDDGKTSKSFLGIYYPLLSYFGPDGLKNRHFFIDVSLEDLSENEEGITN